MANEDSYSSYYNPAVAMAPDGRFVVAWHQWDKTDGGVNSWEVFARRYDADGTPLGASFRVNAVSTGLQSSPAVAMAADGSFVVAFVDERDYVDPLMEISARRFDANGGPIGQQLSVNQTSVYNQYTPSIGMDAAGNFVIGWSSEFQDGFANGVFARTYAADGTPTIDHDIQLNAGWSNDEIMDFYGLGVAPDGSFAATWQSGTYGTNDYDMFARRFSPDGTPLTGDLPVNTYTVGLQAYGSLAVDPYGGFLVTWVSDGQDGSGFGVYAQRFAPDGTRIGGETRVNSTTLYNQYQARVAADGQGNFVTALTSEGYDGSGQGIIGQQIEGGSVYEDDCPSPVPVVSVSADDPWAVAWSYDGQTGRTTGAFVVSRTGDLAKTVTVNYHITSDSTAAADAYQALSGTVQIPVGSRYAGIVVTPEWTDRNESGSLVIQLDASPDYVLGPMTTGTMNVFQDTEVTPVPTYWNGGDPLWLMQELDSGAVELPGLVTTGAVLVRQIVPYGDPNDTVTVTLGQNTDSTTTPSDYRATFSPITVTAQRSYAAVVVTPTMDGLNDEVSEALRIEVKSAVGGTYVGGAYAQVNIDADPLLAANTAPVPLDDTRTVSKNGSPVIHNRLVESSPGVLANDSDADGDPLHVAAVDRPPHARVFTWDCCGGFVYEPERGFVGDDTFKYYVSDGIAWRSATVTIHVINDAPVAVNDQHDVEEGVTLEVPSEGVLVNDTDRNGDGLTAVLVDGPDYAEPGSFHLNSDGSFTYRLAATLPMDFDGQDSFTYKASDGSLFSSVAMVTLDAWSFVSVPAIDVDIDLDVNNNMSIDDPVDRVVSYLPGDEGGTPKLSTGTTFNAPGYQGQRMNIVVKGGGTNAGITKVEFEILSDVTSYEGFAENATSDVVTGNGKKDDYSFLPLEDKRTYTAIARNPNDPKENGEIRDDYAFAAFWCKDYGGYCKVKVTVWKDEESTTKTLQIPVDEDGDQLADGWELGQYNRWVAQYPGDTNWKPLSYTRDGDDEYADPDWRGPLSGQKTAGDRIPVSAEYRGFVLDGGADDVGQTAGGHKRLGTARKEGLWEVDHQANLADLPAEGLNGILNLASQVLQKTGIRAYYIIDQTNLVRPATWSAGDSEGVATTNLGNYLSANRGIPGRTDFLQSAIKKYFSHTIFLSDTPKADPQAVPPQKSYYRLSPAFTYGNNMYLAANPRHQDLDIRGTYILTSFLKESQLGPSLVGRDATAVAHEYMHLLINPPRGLDAWDGSEHLKPAYNPGLFELMTPFNSVANEDPATVKIGEATQQEIDFQANENMKV